MRKVNIGCVAVAARHYRQLPGDQWSIESAQSICSDRSGTCRLQAESDRVGLGFDRDGGKRLVCRWCLHWKLKGRLGPE